MNALEVIGRTAVAYLTRAIGTDDAGDGTQRFLLDRLTGSQVAAICREILSRPALAAQVRIHIPREVGQPNGLPEEILTDERTTHWRHATCDRPILLIANTDDDQGQSLRDITPVGSSELLGEPSLWVPVVADGLGLTDQQLGVFEKALKGLQDAKPVSLDTFATYVLTIRQAIEEQGLPLVNALGWALPVLRVPRDSAYFEVIPEQFRTHAQRWKRLYQQGFNKRAAYLVKTTPTQQPISPEQLNEMWQRVADAVPPLHHSLVEAFIAAPAKWCSEAEALSALEWERDNIKALFDGLKARRESLGQTTLDFYEGALPDSLTSEEEEYLQRLDARRTREPNEEDDEFYERHRAELRADRTLKSRWDRFIYGQPIETDDFAIGLLRCLERLFEQAGPSADSRRLRIESQRRSRNDWLDMNYEAAAYFSRRYRAIRALTTRRVEWQVGDIFTLERAVDRLKERGKFKKNTSTAKAANQVKFYITLECTTARATESYSAQMVWRFNPNGICSEFAEDWTRVVKHPFFLSGVSRESVSKKGKLQAIDLADVGTLMPVFRQDRGSLVGPYDAHRDLAILIPHALDAALQDRRIVPDGHTALTAAWQRFCSSYTAAVTDGFAEGVSSPVCLELESTYAELLESLIRHAPGDGNRKYLWEPILQLGVAVVEGTPPAAIVAPWHPLRLLGMAVKTRQVCGLINHLLTADTVDFGDARLFFSDLTEELNHPYYPEVCVGIHGTQPVLLARSDALADYTLMEPPTVYAEEDDATNENANETAKQILDLVQRYLALQPHERANLSIALYNCNSARLPEATVNMLGNLYEDEEEVRCQVILRHHNAERLHELYEKILEGADNDTDSFVASEASRDFMARLRIGIMADSAPIPAAQDGPPMDIVFLQDVIARLADQVWLTEPSDAQMPALLHHVPPRCSRRRPGTMDDLRSVMYLTSPVQPSVGWRYLQALYGVMQSLDSDLTVRPVPARQISFQNNLTRTIFDEVHRLAQWVVNYDDLLTRRQLRNQGVQVIRYQQHPHGGRNMTISSRAPLNLLEVLVQRRLYSLNLELDPGDLRDLTRRMVDDANTISGDIVLRAAKRGQFASELIGLVLSRFLLQDELGNPPRCGWYFLDDYAMWFGQREEHLADILALSPQRRGDEFVLLGLISEAKYVGRSALADARRSSAVQLRETVLRMQEALFGNPSRLDRDLWLARLADIILDGIEIPATEGNTLHQWRDSIRSGTAPLLLKGYSHVFVHSQEADAGDPSERIPLTNVDHAWQEIYGRDQVRQLVLAYHRHESPRGIRGGLGDDAPWDEGDPTPPSARVVWTAVPRNSAVQSPDTASDNGASAPPAPEPTSRTAGPRHPEPPTPTASDPASLPPGALALVRTTTPPHPDVPDRPEIPPSPDFGWAGPDLQRTLSCLAPRDPVPPEDQSWLNAEVSRLRSALLSYGLQARVIGSRLTPNAALVRLQGSDRLRITDIEHRRDELLTTHGLNITNVLAEPGQVVISVARPQRQTVSLIDVWRNRALDPSAHRSNQMLVVGVREANGETLYLCPEEPHAPHTLIAGTTGSGKSVLIQNLLLDIAITNDPANARIILIDPKQGADYLDLRPLQHIHGGIIVTQDQARVALESAVEEMDRRYALFHAAGVANLVRYNAQLSPEQRLPRIWLFHDEFAVWMLTDDYKETVSNTVQRLGVMARAAGIFLVFAAQRPEDRVMPLQLRDNLGNRFVLRVESPGTSKIALGEEGAERLLGKGHLAVRLPNEDRIILAQVPILTPEQIRAIVAAICGPQENVR